MMSEAPQIDFRQEIRSDSGENSISVRRLYSLIGIDYYAKGGSLLLSFNGEDEEVLESEALVLIGIRNNQLSSIEILLDSREVIKKLEQIFSEIKEKL